jgi:hypothetical protein
MEVIIVLVVARGLRDHRVPALGCSAGRGGRGVLNKQAVQIVEPILVQVGAETIDQIGDFDFVSQLRRTTPRVGEIRLVGLVT